MPRPRTLEERCFGLACVRLTLERRGVDPTQSEIYRGALNDLGCTDDEVVAFLKTNLLHVDAALRRRAPSRPEPR